MAYRNDHTCALSPNFDVKCWGTNGYGQLGLGHTNTIGNETFSMGDNLTLLVFESSFIPKYIFSGKQRTCSLSFNDDLVCWGRNDFGQLGYEDSDSRGNDPSEMGSYLPIIDLGSNLYAIELTTTGDHSCSILSNFEVKCWGLNTYGQLGLGDSYLRGDSANEMGDNLINVNLGTGLVPKKVSSGADHTVLTFLVLFAHSLLMF